MTDNELLLALSDMLDTKLKSELQPLRNDLRNEMQALRDDLHAEIQEVRHELHTEIQAVKEELHAEIQAVKEELHAEIQAVRNELRAEIQEIRHDFQDLQTKVLLLQLNQETKIIPRLNTIESCYLDTFKRYQNNADRMEATFEDVSLLKKVVAGHSAQLQKLA